MRGVSGVLDMANIWAVGKKGNRKPSFEMSNIRGLFFLFFHFYLVFFLFSSLFILFSFFWGGGGLRPLFPDIRLAPNNFWLLTLVDPCLTGWNWWNTDVWFRFHLIKPLTPSLSVKKSFIFSTSLNFFTE